MSEPTLGDHIVPRNGDSVYKNLEKFLKEPYSAITDELFLSIKNNENNYAGEEI